jgi:putative zinc finger/helix-turn-helix YgiT family protein
MSELRYCFHCQEDVGYRLFSRDETRVVKGVKVRVRIDYALCEKCGEPVDVPSLASQNEIRVFDAYKKKAGLLTSEEIKEIRKRYGLSAAKFAKRLGMGEKSITRYENGAIQTKEVDLLLRLVSLQENFDFILRLPPASLAL